MTAWDSEQLWLKAKMFFSHAYEHEQGSAMFAFWSALSLECLARSALTSIHPVLNADPREDLNILYALGYQLTAKPRSLPAHSVYIRLEKVVPKFGKAQRELCDFIALQRNAHVHSGELPYENLTTGKWLPRFYETVLVLNDFLNKSLADFVGDDDVATAAVQLIKALNENLLGTVAAKIAAHKKVFDGKSDSDKVKLSDASHTAAMNFGHGENVASCPACASTGKVTGQKVKEFPEKYEDGQLLMDIQFLAIGFKCPACDLVLNGVEEIAHAGIDMQFIETVATSLHDLYEPEFEMEYDNM